MRSCLLCTSLCLAVLPAYADDKPAPGNVYEVPGTQFELASDRGAITPQLGAHVVGSVGPITAEQLQHLGPPYNASSAIGKSAGPSVTLVPGEAIGRIPAETRTSRLPCALPGCGL